MLTSGYSFDALGEGQDVEFEVERGEKGREPSTCERVLPELPVLLEGTGLGRGNVLQPPTRGVRFGLLLSPRSCFEDPTFKKPAGEIPKTSGHQASPFR